MSSNLVDLKVTEFAAKVARDFVEHLERLTEQQLADAIGQAIRSGDFERLVTTDGKQQVVYLPGRRADELARRCQELERELAVVRTERDILFV